MLKKKRLISLAVVQMLIMVTLLSRLVYIQLVGTESFSKHEINLLEAAVKQRTQVFTIDDGRGKFYDRFEKPLGHQEIPTLILFPFLSKMNWPIKTVAGIIGVSEESLINALKNAKEPFAFQLDGKPISLSQWQMDQINKLKIPGVFAVKQNFYLNNMPAQQLIGGFTKDPQIKRKRYPDREFSMNTVFGDRGLQYQFDEFLLSDGDTRLVFHVDGTGGPLFGLDVKFHSPANPMYPVKVITTIDLDLQKQAEKLVDQHGIDKGGLVLLDIETSEIRALVSRPNVNQKDPNKGEGAVNMMFRRSTPGSVFKTVVAAAAIETGIIERNKLYNCNLTVDGKEDKNRRLGMLDFEKSFAQSCNRTFGELAKELAHKDPGLLEKYAELLNITGTNGWNNTLYHQNFKQLYQEDPGQVWLKKAYSKDQKLVAHTAIGQQDVQASPLAIANMMATIARGGQRKMVKAVSRVEFANGTTEAKFYDSLLGDEQISKLTSIKLQELLKKVVEDEEGTGRALQNLPYQVAGKSGTAQTNKEKGLLNRWFAGYFPYNKPKYALVVVRLDATEDQGGVTGLYADMVKEIYKQDMKE